MSPEARRDPFDMQDRVAVITGGAGMLGREHAAALLASGARVAIADINASLANEVSERLGKESGQDRVLPLPLDITDAAAVAAGLAAVLKRFSRVDVLINNAALDPKVQQGSGLNASRFEHFALKQWEMEIAVGLTGAYLCSQAFGTWMAERGSGVILNIASDLSVFAPDQRIYRKPGLPDDQQPAKPVTYSVIKTGLVGLTSYLAAYWADKGVRVNALSPGGVYADQPPEFVTRLTGLIPLGRMARADEYRSAIQFLCSDASSYMTGQNVVMDGGRSVW